jgi:hypothetical protein
VNRWQRLMDVVRFAFEGDMPRADRARWAAASSLADLGEMNVAWLHGEIRQTPSRCGPPQDETIPHVEVLAAVNRAGFVTTNSQSAITAAEAAEHGWMECEAWVCGLAGDETLGRLRAALAGTPLLIGWTRGRESHGTECRYARRAWRDETHFYSDRCPDAAAGLRAAWWVIISDPEPGRNDRLWPAIEAFSAAAKGEPS